MPTGIYLRTKENTRKAREGLRKLHASPLGEKLRKKISEGSKKYFASLAGEETKKRMSERLKKAHREGNIAEQFLKGAIPWNKDKKGVMPVPWNKDTKGVMKVNSGSFKKGHSMWDSKECREKMLQARQKRYLSGEPTSIEKKVYDELKARGLLFETQKLINGKFLVDAYIPSLNLIIEADGDYFHSLDKVMKKDKAENAYLKKCGFNLLRISGTEIRNDSFKDKLNKFN